MRKCTFLLAIIVSILMLSSCNAKLSTIRPTLITRIEMEDLRSGEKAELNRDEEDEIDWLMDDLVIQMEQFYKKTGACTVEDQHVYRVEYNRGDEVEMYVIVNADGSICKQDNHYVLADKDEDEIASYLEDWEEAFSLGKTSEED